MASPVADTITAASGTSIFCGRIDTDTDFTRVQINSEDSAVPYTNTGQILVLSLHGSGGSNTTSGRQYRADVSGPMAYDTHNVFSFSTVRDTTARTLLRPVDNYGLWTGGARRESMWMGFSHIPDVTVSLLTQRRLEALMRWVPSNITNIVPSKTCITGGSMGGWGTMSFGLRRPTMFAAMYPDRPRWRYNNTVGNIAVSNYLTLFESVPVASAPNLTARDGGGSVNVLMDHIAYVSNTANVIPWIGWCVGRNDGFTQFSDHAAAVVAMRAAGRGFAFAWNNGDHTTGSIIAQITNSYPFGTFEIGKGYPIFTNHSLDSDPEVDLVGGINVGLSFRNVVETSSGWSCEVTSILAACTVNVKPHSSVFVTSVSSQSVTIPSANTWVSVSFSA